MSVGPVPACPGGTAYSIRAGDTLYLLASRYGTTVAAIRSANPGLNPNNLQVGQVICLPVSAAAGCLGGTIYYVQAGDTFFLIAQRFGISVGALAAANPGINPQQLQIGQTICLPGLAVPAAPCCWTLTSTAAAPPANEVPFPPAGSLLLQSAGPGNTAVTFAVSGLPDPGAFGQFDSYAGRIILPAPRANAPPEIFAVDLAAARAFEQPVAWAGSRVILRSVLTGTAAAVYPFNAGTGALGNALLRATVGPCR